MSYMNSVLFFFNDTATTEIYTLSLHDALPIYGGVGAVDEAVDIHVRAEGRDAERFPRAVSRLRGITGVHRAIAIRSEDHTSELQSRQYLVCRLLLEKKQINA